MLSKEQIDAMFEKAVKAEFGEVDSVNHPPHYNTGNIEVIDFIESLGFSDGFCLGNAIKYISRAGKKEGSTTKEDISKAIWYLNRYLQSIKDEED